MGREWSGAVAAAIDWSRGLSVRGSITSPMSFGTAGGTTTRGALDTGGEYGDVGKATIGAGEWDGVDAQCADRANYDLADDGLRRLRAPAHDAEALAAVLQDPDIGALSARRALGSQPRADDARGLQPQHSPATAIGLAASPIRCSIHPAGLAQFRASF